MEATIPWTMSPGLYRDVRGAARFGSWRRLLGLREDCLLQQAGDGAVLAAGSAENGDGDFREGQAARIER
ncbi:hypothetical protein ACFQ60_47275 [Streptomyces zhihengii]